MLDHRTPTARELVPALLVLLAAAPSQAVAQSGSAASFRVTPAATLKQALRSTAAAQARFRADNGRYATSFGELRLRLQPEVAVEVVAATATGWQARAMHRYQPGKSCVIFVGALDGVEPPRTDGDREMAGEDGVPLCDRMR